MSSVTDGLNGANPRRPAHNRKPLDIASIILRYEAGESENAIAKALSVNRWSVRRRLLESGAAVRGQSDAERMKWSRMSRAKRVNQVAAAHASVKGRKATDDERIRNAISRQHSMPNVGPAEVLLTSYLRRRGVTVIQQQACGRYNIDIAVENTVAVEIFGGHWHRQRPRAEQFRKRARDLFNAGWHLYVIWVDKRHHPLTDISDDLIAFGEAAGRSPSTERQYRVVRGDGKFIASGSSDDERLTFIPTSRRGLDGRFHTDGAR